MGGRGGEGYYHEEGTGLKHERVGRNTSVGPASLIPAPTFVIQVCQVSSVSNVLLHLSAELPFRHEPRCAASVVFYPCTVEKLDRYFGGKKTPVAVVNVLRAVRWFG